MPRREIVFLPVAIGKHFLGRDNVDVFGVPDLHTRAFFILIVQLVGLVFFILFGPILDVRCVRRCLGVFLQASVLDPEVEGAAVFRPPESSVIDDSSGIGESGKLVGIELEAPGVSLLEIAPCDYGMAGIFVCRVDFYPKESKIVLPLAPHQLCVSRALRLQRPQDTRCRVEDPYAVARLPLRIYDEREQRALVLPREPRHVAEVHVGGVRERPDNQVRAFGVLLAFWRVA